MATRTRNVQLTQAGVMKYDFTDGRSSYQTEVVPAVFGAQTTISSGNDIRSLRELGAAAGNIGSNFSTSKRERHGVLNITSKRLTSSGSQTYVGPLTAADGTSARWNHSGQPLPYTSSQMDMFGTRAIANCAPTAPSADLSVFLGELLREGVPKAVGAAMLKSKFRDYRDIGDEYLNVQFGWLPFVSDLRKISQAIIDQESRMAQLVRDSGRNVRRRFEMPSAVVTSGYVYDAVPGRAWPNLTTGHYSTPGFAYSYTSHETRTWFEGMFTYHFALADRQSGKLARQAQFAQKILGLDLTPAVVWNLAPWSWLADWVANTGDVLTNVSQFNRDDLAMRYGYVMSTNIRESVWVKGNFTVLNAGKPATHVAALEDRYRSISKQRSRATPYGFGLNTDGFSNRQWAILGALGISRGPSRAL